MNEPQQPKRRGKVFPNNRKSLVVVIDGPADTTVRPLRPSLRELAKRYQSAQQPPPPENPPPSGQDAPPQGS
jgi:hypothetical protein